MFKKTIIAGLVASAFVPELASAADSPHTLTGNVGIYSQYIFRGLMQTNKGVPDWPCSPCCRRCRIA